MEEDIKIIKNLISYLQEKISNGEDKIFYNELMWDEKTIDCINALEDIVQAYKEDEAVIKEMVKDKYKNIDMYEVAEMANEIDYKLVDLFNGIPEEKGYEVIEQYFRKKVKDERNKV